MDLSVEDILQRGQFSLINTAALMGTTREKYPEWAATSWTPRRATAYGDTPRAAVEALLKELQII